MAAYCTAADLDLPQEALNELDASDITEAISRASAMVDSYLASRFTLPLVQVGGAWPEDLVDAAAGLATYRLMKRRGYNPAAGQNDTIRQGYQDAVKYLKDVSKGDATPQVRGSNSDAVTQEGGGPSSSAFVLQAPDGAGCTYSAEEDFWHDRPSCPGAPGNGPRRRGY